MSRKIWFILIFCVSILLPSLRFFIPMVWGQSAELLLFLDVPSLLTVGVGLTFGALIFLANDKDNTAGIVATSLLLVGLTSLFVIELSRILVEKHCTEMTGNQPLILGLSAFLLLLSIYNSYKNIVK